MEDFRATLKEHPQERICFLVLAQGRTLGSLAYLPNAKLGSVLQLVYMMMGILFLSLRSCEEDRRRLHRLRCSVTDYAWGKIGSDSLVYRVYAVNSDEQIDSTRPYAELWMGTHESGPSYLEDDADGVTLRSWIAENPEALGDRVLDKWGCDLSFLFKSLERQLCSNEVMVRHELGQRQESLLRFRYLGISNGLMLLMFLSSRGYKNLISISIISLHTTIMDEDKANSKTPNIS
ncbi:unnamed protein product [Brassica oleracea]